MASWRSTLALLLCLLPLADSLELDYDESMRPLIGGIMWWSIDPRFNEGQRRATFIVLTVFQQHPDCNYIVGAEVTCANDLDIRRRHGEICVKELVEDPRVDPEDGNVRVLWAPDHDGSDGRSCVGAQNQFKVLSTHDKNEEQLFDRKANNLDLVIGRMSHTVNVSRAATGLFAYMTGPNGTMISEEQGMLLRKCTRIGSDIPCSHNTVELLAAGKQRFAGGANTYWNNFLKNMREDPLDPLRIYPLSHGSPALETYVPLCSASSGPLQCSDYPVGNYFSPQIGLPPLIEVAVTAKTVNSTISYPRPQRASFGTGEGLEGTYTATADPIIFKVFDYDGQPVTLYDQANSGETKQDRIAKCWMADADTHMNELGVCAEEGVDNGRPCDFSGSSCLRGECIRHWPSKVCKGLPSVVDRWCLVDSDCYDEALNRTGTCEGSWSNCRTTFDFDRNENNRAGNLIKFDYDWTYYQFRERYFPSGMELDHQPFVRTVSPTFMQHVMLAVDAPFRDVDNPSSLRASEPPQEHILQQPPFSSLGLTERPSFVPAASSIIFATYPCDAGIANQPPRFVKSIEPLDASPPEVTEIECPWYETCVVDFYAVDFEMREDGSEGAMSKDKIAIQSAYNIPEELTIAGAEVDCVGRDGVDLGKLHCQWRVKHREAPGGLGGYVADATGEMINSCFVALDVHDACSPGSRDKCTCRSMPLCVKVKFTGRKPYFALPTPLAENSKDDTGVTVRGRTDIPACEGVPISLTLAAKDGDGNDLVRIFAWDLDVDMLDPAATSQHLYLEPGGRYQSDFFAAGAISFGEDADTCGAFNGFNASKVGANAAQADITSIAPSGAQAMVKTVMGAYRSEIEYQPAPELRIVYTPHVERGSMVGNGLDIVRWETCSEAAMRTGPNGTAIEASKVCREKRSNADQVICAYAYDNARSVRRRWVGETNPNGNDRPVWTRDHSNGDLASEQHCWRISMQAPPVFVSDNLGNISPFDAEWLQRTKEAFESTTGTEPSYKKVRLAVEEEYEYTFIAQDPQAGDVVSILVQEDPGVPRNMRVGNSLCLPREATEHPMCQAADMREEWFAPVEPKTGSTCSKAMRTLSWKPAPEEAGERHYRACLTARDDSTSCSGIHSDAMHTGWYGETLCILMEVVEPKLEWDAATQQMLDDKMISGHVGCNMTVVFTAHDASITIGSEAAGGNYELAVEAHGDHVLERAHVLPAEHGNPSSLAVVWKPVRGEEGLEFQLCASARDEHQMRALGMTCKGGARDGMVCGGIGTHELCGEGGVCTPSHCVTIRVERCRYCAQAGESLSNIAREYAMDMNWLRLWALNGNRKPPDAPWGTVVTNPDFIATGTTEQHLLLGVAYRIKAGETLQHIADRFRTTVKSILNLNFDITDEDGIKAGNEVCIMPCSSFALQESMMMHST